MKLLSSVHWHASMFEHCLSKIMLLVGGSVLYSNLLVKMHVWEALSI